MPDILIRGMEMPDEQPVTLILDPSGRVWLPDTATCKEYMAQELPPHGDLIQRSDVLAVVDEAYEYGDIIKRKDFYEGSVPTIVPAERREGDG